MVGLPSGYRFEGKILHSALGICYWSSVAGFFHFSSHNSLQDHRTVRGQIQFLLLLLPMLAPMYLFFDVYQLGNEHPELPS
ncbi:hypothetical protein F4805DRAFT_439802 [Annulohypoxylon moriforme]|nr:hypothetical protein F4805DRAFT_439802 [Annulohypoxylon moriforme]